MTVKEHYDNHLGHLYSWMIGDFKSKATEFENFLKENSILPIATRKAIDLGAGHGVQSVPLARLGFNVIAIDFNQQLLDELKGNSKGLRVETLNDDLRNLNRLSNREPELILCCGDTLSHLNSKAEIQTLITDIYNTLIPGGKVLFSFRDYSTELQGDKRFLPVKSDNQRILTCVLEYDKETVRVTDLLNEKTGADWNLKVSSYIKVRISTNQILGTLVSAGFRIQYNSVFNSMMTIIGIKK